MAVKPGKPVMIDLGPAQGILVGRRFEVDELGAPPTAPRRGAQAGALVQVQKLLGQWDRPGPLMVALMHEAEYEHRGGHLHGRA